MVSANVRSGPSPSAVDFPSSDAPGQLSPPPQTQHTRPPYLPFRRISLPSAPNLLHRQSVVSVASFDSLPEEGSTPSAVMPAVMRNAVRKSKGRPYPPEANRRGSRTRLSKPGEEARETKRRKVIHEFCDTEKAYVDGLELIYSQFLTPIIASLDTPQPLLDRAELTSVFSNFIDIWNLHRSFFSSLTAIVNPADSGASPGPLPPLSPILLSHFPYLSLYSPFVTSFPDAISALTSLLSNNAPFAAFVSKQESDPRCGKLKLRDWLLTIVQRCPRYLLLLKDLINCTEPDDPEHAQLTAVHTLVSKITLSLNTSLHTHAQTLSLLALQRSTPNLPFQLISPGRTFLKRGPLLQLEYASSPREREFLLFSDCLVWLASADHKNDGDPSDKWEWGGGGGPAKGKNGGRPLMLRSRSKSEAELPTLNNTESDRPGPSKLKARYASSSTDDKWLYRGRAELVDLEVVVTAPRDLGDERRLEILSPETSFAVYASNEAERDEWAAAIRNAKSSLLISLNAMHPNSTLTSSSSTNHLRRSLQALPHLPQDEPKKPRRGKVEHFVPAIWIPDGKTQSCMRCGRVFGWRRRRHHCRLCGRCVCSSCSSKTFFISDSKHKDGTKSARSCDACYEAVFPLLEQSVAPSSPELPASQSNSTLSGFPSWLTMPSFPLTPERWQAPSADALMAIDVGSPRRPLHRIDDEEGSSGQDTPGDGRDATPSPMSRIRPKSAVRPRSYHQILEDFQDQEEQGSASRPSETEDHSEETDDRSSRGTSVPPSPRREDTARRHKRYSLPAVALQTNPVTARPNATGEGQSKRYSLVLGRSSGSAVQAQARLRQQEGELSGGVAAAKLNELLKRQ